MEPAGVSSWGRSGLTPRLALRDREGLLLPLPLVLPTPPASCLSSPSGRPPVLLFSQPGYQQPFRKSRASVPWPSSDFRHHYEKLCEASLIFSCWSVSSSDPLAKLSGVASLTMLDVPHDNVDGGGGSGQLTHLLCSASHGFFCVCASPSALCPCGYWPFPLAAVALSTVGDFARVPRSASF